MIKSVNNQNFKIIAVSNRKLCNRPFLEQIERVCKIHPEAVILREKDLTEEEYGTLAKEVMNICSRYQVSCILHNFWKTALELGCTSVHLPLPILQKITDEEKKKFTKIGISIQKQSNWELPILRQGISMRQIVRGDYRQEDWDF